MRDLTELLRRKPTTFTLNEIEPILKANGFNVLELPRLSDSMMREEYWIDFSNVVVKPIKTETGIKTQIEGEYTLQARTGYWDKRQGSWLPGRAVRYRFVTLDEKIKSIKES